MALYQMLVDHIVEHLLSQLNKSILARGTAQRLTYGAFKEMVAAGLEKLSTLRFNEASNLSNSPTFREKETRAGLG